MSTVLHNKPAPTLGRLWSMFGTGSWDQTPSNVKPKADADLDDERKSSKPISHRPLLPAGSLTGNISALTDILWGFIKSDIFTFSLPNVISGVALSLVQEARTTPEGPTLHQVLSRLPASCLFQLLAVLIADCNNQRDPSSVAEDRINKPWRPVPSGKITSSQTRRLLLLVVPAFMAFCYFYGVWDVGLLLIVAVFVYNDLRGNDEFFVREIVLGSAFAIYQTGSLRIALGSGEYHYAHARTDNMVMGIVADVVSPRGYAWTAITGALMATNVPIQDLKDQEGDRTRSRKTLPLFLGDAVTRYYLATTISVSSIVATVFWRTPMWFAVPVVMYAGYIAWRLLARRNKVDDEATWRIWCWWTMLVYSLPAVSALTQ